MRTGKFSNLSATYEPRTIFRTVAAIALDAYRRDPLASFFLVGAADSRDRFVQVVIAHCAAHCRPLLPDGELEILLIDDDGNIFSTTN